MKFRWNAQSLDHIARHSLSAREVEYAFNNRVSAPRNRPNGHDGHSEESWEVDGNTPNGRTITIAYVIEEVYDPRGGDADGVAEEIYVITAFDTNPNALR